MPKLYARMFCSDCPARDRSFGLLSGRMTGQRYRVAHRADWYSAKAEWLGCGDLVAEDVEAIQRKLDPDDLFLVIDKAHAGHHTHPRPLNWQRSLTFVRQHCTIIIAPDGRYIVDNAVAGHRGKNIKPFYGLLFTFISREEARRVTAPHRSLMRVSA